jgi:hypothetical protein
MISQAKLTANARNAKKSTGPVTKEGRKRSSMNSLKHGLTARMAMLPDENPTAFHERLFKWKQILQPRDDLELFQAERAVYLSWQLQRVQSAQSARLCFKAHTAADDQQ